MRIIQTFNWKLADITNNLQEIKSKSFTHIQTSPIQRTKDNGVDWWLLYQPCSLTIGNSQIGSKEDLIELCRESHKLGLKVIVDVVLRHVGTDNLDCDKPNEVVDKELLPYVVQRPRLYNENNRAEVTDNSCGMPMLDYEDQGYQKLCIRFLDELVACGVDMFRLDQAKHYRLPSEGGTFLTNVMSKYEYIGEVLFEEDQEILKQYAELCYVMSMNSLQDKSRMVLNIENHDTFLNTDGVGYTRKMSDELIMSEYNILCNYAINTMFYCRPYNDSWRKEIIKNSNNMG
ncbi:MAG: alpha-amylase family glycosyl hydrolase [Clostridium sp.]|uniref:alpha-amylase family glycosyl hydrolase n=1 Tax=Clostridium sp. TaxID=1506 RepID=UPI003F3B6870